MTKQRPELQNIVNPDTLDKEAFQNKVIRPIIKMQNNLIMRYFSHYLESRKLRFETLTDQNKRKVIQNAINRDISFKNFFVGLVVGHFDSLELESYLQHTSEYNRRIKQIIFQRILDQSVAQ